MKKLSKPPKKKESKKYGKKKQNHDGGPKRSLSAYNIFFREERARILSQGGIEKLGTDNLNHNLGAARFSALGKEIGKRWNSLNEMERTRYKELAATDLIRYREEKEHHRQSVVKVKEDQETMKEAPPKTITSNVVESRLLEVSKTESDTRLDRVAAELVRTSPSQKISTTANAQLQDMIRSQSLHAIMPGGGGLNPSSHTLPHSWQCTALLTPGLLALQEDNAFLLRQYHQQEELLRQVQSGAQMQLQHQQPSVPDSYLAGLQLLNRNANSGLFNLLRPTHQQQSAEDLLGNYQNRESFINFLQRSAQFYHH